MRYHPVMTEYKDFMDESLAVANQFNDEEDYVSLETQDQVWLTEEQVKTLIKDLASRIDHQVILFSPETTARIKELADKE